MNSAATMPDEARLRALLDGTLPEAEQAEVLALVESQPQWQQALDRLAAGAQTWQAAAEHLHQPPPAADAALRSAMAAIQPPTIASDQHPVEHSAKLDFLSPVDDPRYLGRFGEFLVEKVIGRGGFGIVLQAFDPPLRRIVALKVLAPHLASNASACRRFNREALAAAAVVHDHVITIHAVGEKPLPHLVMQYVAGQSLQEKLDKTGPLGTAEVLRIGMQTAAGLAAAHKHGQVHRDIKPANILLENGVERVKITDFGLARAADDASMTQSGVVAGTPQYMSPEQARGEMVDARSDLFSLGSVLYAMCAGHPPFRATTTMGVLKRVCDDPPRPIREINPEVPDWLAAIIDKLMAKRPEDRFASAQQVADLLGQCLSHVQQPAANPLPQPIAGTLRVPSPATAAVESSKEGSNTRSVPATEDPLLDRARRAVREPAIGLVIAGILNWIALAIVFAFLPGLIQGMMRDDTYRWLLPVIAVLGLGSGLMVLGGLKMMRLENRFLVTLASIAAMFIGPAYFIGFPMGLWALIVLQRRDVKEAFAEVRRRHLLGIASLPAELQPPKKPPVRAGVVTAPAPSSSGARLVLFALFLVFAIPLTLLFAAGLGYLLMASPSPPPITYAHPPVPPAPTGRMIYHREDPRFHTVFRRVKSPEGEHVVGGIFGPELQHNQVVLLPPGEYHAEVKSGEIVVREDTFRVVADGPRIQYIVGRAGTLRFDADHLRDGDLVLVLNHITGQTIWDWPNRTSFLIPAGVVHVDLRRPDGKGGYQVLTNDYFDIIAGLETVIRVREKDVELENRYSEFGPIISQHRSNVEAALARYTAGQSTLLEVIEAKLKLELARLQWAQKTDRNALSLSVRQQIIELAQERERLLAQIVERGAATAETLGEARLAVLTQKEELRQAVEDLKKARKLPADFELPPPKQENAAPVDPAAPKAEPRE